jgi:hypothetical protein
VSEEKLYSQTVDRRRRGHGFVNILAHDPATPEELATSPSMQPYKHFNTAEEAEAAAADEAQKDYDNQRKDPNSQWYVPESPFEQLGKDANKNKAK